MLLSSWIKVLEAVQLSQDDVFIDLGSGRGVLAMFTKCAARLKRSVGVELSRERHAMAKRAQAALQAADSRAAAGLEFVNEDIRVTSLTGASFIFFMNQDMPHKLIARVWENILTLQHPVTIATLHAPKDVNLARHGVERINTLTLPETWNAAVDVILFRFPGRTGA